MSRGFGAVPQVLLNGVQLELEDEDLELAVVSVMQQQTYEIQQALFTVCDIHVHVSGIVCGLLGIVSWARPFTDTVVCSVLPGFHSEIMPAHSHNHVLVM